MFGLMKNLIKDYTTPANLVKIAELHAGCVVGFGFVPQKNISGKRIPVSQVNSYLFETDSFAAYRLENGSIDINLIVADDDDPTGSYLALSQRIDTPLFSGLFADKLPQDWFALAANEKVKVITSALGVPQGWLASYYTVAVKTTGRFLEGDYRLRKVTDRNRLSRPFEYVLLVDEDNEHALEAEKYEDGTLRVFATVYRPITDIGEITREPKPVSTPVMDSQNDFMQPSKSIVAGSIDKITHISPSLTDSEKGAATLSAKPVKKSAEITPVESKQTPTLVVSPLPPAKPEVITSPVHTKFGRIQPASSQAASAMIADVLACDLKLAAKLIDEAQRNQILLAELIRKVIDLPARVNEQVLIPFAIDNAETAELARRYNLPAGDTQAVKQYIIEELKRFVGEKS